MREAAIYALITLFFRVLVSRPRRPIVIGNPILLLTIAAAIYLHVGLAPLVLVLVAYGFNLSVSLKALLRVRKPRWPWGAAPHCECRAQLRGRPRTAPHGQTARPRHRRAELFGVGECSEAKSRGSGAHLPQRATGITVVDTAITGAI